MTWKDLYSLQITKELILNYLKEADDLISRGDFVQACEKYYKAAEDFIKYLSKANIRRWDSRALFKESKKFPCVRDLWRSAWKLHVDCFHNYLMDENEIMILISDVRKIRDLIG